MADPPTSNQNFLNRLTEIILANLENENFDVKVLASEFGLPYYSLSRKLHAVKKRTINQFIREVRLLKAREILQNEDLTVSEVAYRVGFSSPAYFNKCFHEYFGHPPGLAKNLSTEVSETGLLRTEDIDTRKAGIKRRGYWPALLFLLFLAGAAAFFLYWRFHKISWPDDQVSPDGRISIAVMPFYNMTRDTSWNIWQEVMQECLISVLSNNKELKVRQKESVNALLESRAITEYSGLSPGIAGNISQKLDASLFVYGSLKRAGPILRLDVELTDTKTSEVVKSFTIEGPFREESIFQLIDTISAKLQNFLLISKMIKEDAGWSHYGRPNTNSPEAIRYCMYGSKAWAKGDNTAAIAWYLKSLAADSNYFDPMQGLSSCYANMGMLEKDFEWVVRYYNKRDHFSFEDQLWASWAYATNFEPPEKAITYLRQIQQMDDQMPNTYYLIGITYTMMKEYSKAIPELEKNLEICRKWGKEFMKNNSAYSELGLAYHKTGQFKKERKIYKLAEKYIPDDPVNYCRQAILALSENDTVAANRYFEKYIVTHRKRYPTWESEIPATRGWIYSEAGYPDKAEEYFRKAISMDENNPERLYFLASFLIDNNRNLNDIQELMNLAMAMAANKVDYYKYMDMKGWGLYKQGRATEALGILQKAWDSAPFPMYIMSAHLQEVKKAVPATQSTAKVN
jgi:AraC-like DNA-binding protein/tetratricopeptide (TPR) repeat protein